MILPDHVTEKIADPAERRRYGSIPKGRPRLERDEQRLFANWCLLHALPFCWHATHRRSTATRGVFDFWVGQGGRSAWLEFKSLPVRLSREQVRFGERLSAQGSEWHIVYSAAEAIAILKGWLEGAP